MQYESEIEIGRQYIYIDKTYGFTPPVIATVESIIFKKDGPVMIEIKSSDSPCLLVREDFLFSCAEEAKKIYRAYLEKDSQFFEKLLSDVDSKMAEITKALATTSGE